MGTYNCYTEEQELFLRQNSFGTSRKKLVEDFNKKFGTNKSLLAIKSWCNLRGILCGNDGRYKKGDKPWHVGLTTEEYKSHFTEESFKKSIEKILPKRIHEIGDTIERRKNDFWVITDITPNVCLDNRSTHKRRYVYEKAHGKIPPRHRIVHLDGDKTNFKLENLYCIPAKFIPLINKNHWLTDSREHTLTAIKWCELYFLTKNKKGESK